MCALWTTGKAGAASRVEEAKENGNNVVLGRLRPVSWEALEHQLCRRVFPLEIGKGAFYPHPGYWGKTLGKGAGRANPRQLQVWGLPLPKCKPY